KSDEGDAILERLISLIEPRTSIPLMLDAPDDASLENLISLDPVLLDCATAFEKRLIFDAVEAGKLCYVVTLRPSEKILKTSFEPLDLYRMLEVVGDILLNLPILEDVPDIAEYDTDKYYFSFKFLVASDYAPDLIEDLLATFYEIGEMSARLCNKNSTQAQN
ncbi:MAG: hypothetical protein JW941_12465, partial [Candidatus Coatesbacteria bacterium]|nr:hypothetical protein [Candidatus Coatesbacteria bacterium]